MRIIVLFLTAFVISCSSESPTASDNIEDFEKFHEQFLSDSLFQMSRIEFPLKGAKSTFIPDSLKTNFWFEDEWLMHRDVGTVEGYQHKFVRHNNTVIEVFYDDLGGGIQKNYLAIDGKWQLIYYADYNRFEPSFLESIKAN